MKLLSSKKNTASHTLGYVHREICKILQCHRIDPHDAPLIIEYVTGLGIKEIIAYPETPFSQKNIKKVEALLVRRIQGEPFAYIKGIKEFYGRDFFIEKSVLIPRPETESIIDIVLDILQKSFSNKTPPIILDCGTGSGCIGITVAAECIKKTIACTVVLSDISKDALSVARKNINHILPTSLPLYHSYLLSNKELYDYFFTIIIANLPYVPLHEYAIMHHSLQYEPYNALVGTIDKADTVINSQGIYYIKELLHQLSHYNHSHYVFLEHSPLQCDSICTLASLYGYNEICIHTMQYPHITFLRK